MNKNELQKTYQKIVLKTNGGVDDYVVALCQIGNAIGELDDPQQQIVDLQYRLKVAEKALELACNEELRSFGEYDEDYGYEKQFQMLKEQYLEQAEKELKGEE